MKGAGTDDISSVDSYCCLDTEIDSRRDQNTEFLKCYKKALYKMIKVIVSGDYKKLLFGRCETRNKEILCHFQAGLQEYSR